ncbi:MAG TPA: competence/damage-inducible protein A [Syntrophales bacterium]
MKIGILTIGDEITSGRIQDTNTAYLAREFHVRGWEVAAAMSVGDNSGDIRGALDCILSVSDGVVVTGGLGPTADDITTEAIAEIYGLRLFTDEAVLQTIKDRFASRGLRWSDNNAKQAMFPEEAVPLRNPVGTAWGFCLKRVGKPIVVLPGVPMEVKKMVPEVVIPLFEKEDPAGKKAMVVKTVKLFGLGEALIDEALADLKYDHEHVSLGFYPRFPENHLVITSWHNERSRAEENLAGVLKGIQERVKRNIFGYDEDTLEGMIGVLLTEKKLTISVAESLTGGLVADRITNIPGSSAYFERGVVTYSNRSKTELLGVPENVIKQHGGVSKEVAVLMAEGVRKASGTDIGLSTTGIAGPSGGTDQKPVGTVFVAVSDGKRTICRDFLFKWERRRIKEITTQWALDLTRRFLSGEDHVQ